MRQKINWDSLVIGVFIGFTFTLLITGYIVGISTIPKHVLYQKEYYMDGIRFTIKRN